MPKYNEIRTIDTQRSVKMFNKVTASILFLVCSSVAAETLYLSDGTEIEVPVGSKVYVSDVPLWKFTKFDAEGFDIRSQPEVAAVVEQCTDGGLTFGGSSVVCEEVFETPEEEGVCDELTFGGSGC